MQASLDACWMCFWQHLSFNIPLLSFQNGTNWEGVLEITCCVSGRNSGAPCSACHSSVAHNTNDVKCTAHLRQLSQSLCWCWSSQMSSQTPLWTRCLICVVASFSQKNAVDQVSSGVPFLACILSQLKCKKPLLPWSFKTCTLGLASLWLGDEVFVGVLLLQSDMHDLMYSRQASLGSCWSQGFLLPFLICIDNHEGVNARKPTASSQQLAASSDIQWGRSSCIFKAWNYIVHELST